MLGKLAWIFMATAFLFSCAQSPDPRNQEASFIHGSTNSLLYEACENQDGLSCRKLGDKFAEGVGVTAHKGVALKYYDRACRYEDEIGCEIYDDFVERAANKLLESIESR